MSSQRRTSAFSNRSMAADVVAFIEQVEVEGCCYKEPQPLVTLSLSRNLAAFSEEVEAEES